VQALDKNTCKLVAGEFNVLVVDKAEEAVTDKVSPWIYVTGLCG
jgi:hypothetical protein